MIDKFVKKIINKFSVHETALEGAIYPAASGTPHTTSDGFSPGFAETAKKVIGINHVIL